MGLFCWQHIMSLWTPSPLLPLRRQSLASLFKHWPPMPDSRAVCLNGDIAISGLFAVLILRNAIQPRGSRFYVTMWVCLEIEHTAAYPSIPLIFFPCVWKMCGKWKKMENNGNMISVSVSGVGDTWGESWGQTMTCFSTNRVALGIVVDISETSFGAVLSSVTSIVTVITFNAAAQSFNEMGQNTGRYPSPFTGLSSTLIIIDNFPEKMPFNSHHIAMKTTSPCFKKSPFSVLATLALAKLLTKA